MWRMVNLGVCWVYRISGRTISWTGIDVLGNAYLALFFCNTHSPSDLDRAFTAYRRAEAAGAEKNPDLHFNRASVCRYKEDYADAMKCYECAHKLDPLLPAQEAIDTIGRWVTRVADLILRKVGLFPGMAPKLISL